MFVEYLSESFMFSALVHGILFKDLGPNTPKARSANMIFLVIITHLDIRHETDDMTIH